MSKSTAPLTPLMLAALQTAKRGAENEPLMVSTLIAASTFRGLLARELIKRTGALTGAGMQIRHKALPPGADLDQDTEEIPVDNSSRCKKCGRWGCACPAADAAEELKLAGLRTMSSEQLQWVLEVAEQDGDTTNQALVRQVINERLEQVLAPQPESTGDRYARGSMSQDVKARDARLDAPSDSANRVANTIAGHLLPQRVPGVALTEELTGETAPQRQFCRQGMHPCVPAVTLTFDGGTRRLHWCQEHASGADEYRAQSDTPAQPAQSLLKAGEDLTVLVGTARPGYRPSVLLRPVTGTVVERASRETFLAVGSDWGPLEGKRVRIACMDGDVFHQRPLMLSEAGARELDWVKPEDKTVHMPRALHVGSTVLVDGCRVYQVDRVSPVADLGLTLRSVR